MTRNVVGGRFFGSSRMAFVLAILFLCLALGSPALIDHINAHIGTSFHKEQRWDVHDYGNCNMPVGPPFAHTPWTAQTRANEAKCTSPYYYFDDYWHGLRRTHWMSGSCTIDYGSATVLPATSPSLNAALTRHAMDHSAEEATPAYYAMRLAESSLLVEAASASRSGILRVTPTAAAGSVGGSDVDPATGEAAPAIADADDDDDDDGGDDDLYFLFAAFDSRHNKSTVKFLPAATDNDGCVDEVIISSPVHRWYQSRGEFAHFSGHHYFKLSQPACTYGMIEQRGLGREWVRTHAMESTSSADGPAAAYVKYSRRALGSRPLLVYTGASFVSPDKAFQNLHAELAAVGTLEEASTVAFVTLEALRDATARTWEEKLQKLRVTPHADAADGGRGQLTTFYTAVWRSLLLPRVVSDFDGEYLSFGDATRRVVNTADDDFGRYFDDFSMWDIYRAQVPLFHLVYTEDVRDMVVSLLVKARHGGWLPIFPAWHSYTDEMIGDHCAVLIADAFAKGVLGVDRDGGLFDESLRYMLKNALTVSPPTEYKMGMGRRALASYLRYGFVPLDDEVLDSPHPRQQVSRTLEYAYDDFVVAQAAQLWLDSRGQRRGADVCQAAAAAAAAGTAVDGDRQACAGAVEGLGTGDEVDEVRRAARRLLKSSENYLWVLDGPGVGGRASVSSGQRCASPGGAHDVSPRAEEEAKAEAHEADGDGDHVCASPGDDDDDAPTGFVRPRFSNFSWAEPAASLDPVLHYPWLTETSVWQYAFSVPHNVEGMVRAYGGPEAFAAKLDTFFDGGHYNHGNEPDHHALFLYAYVPGHTWKIAHRLSGIVASQYGPTERGLSGNEDAGQMSAWLVLASVGLYQVCPGCGGDNEYVLGLPLFARVEVELTPSPPDGTGVSTSTSTSSTDGRGARRLVISVRGPDGAEAAPGTTTGSTYIQRVTWNGCPYDCAFFPHSVLTGPPHLGQGDSSGRGDVNELVVFVGPRPNTTWGGVDGRGCMEKVKIECGYS